MARKAKGSDDEGYRSEFIRLAESAEMLAKAKPGNNNTGEDVEDSKPLSKNK